MLKLSHLLPLILAILALPAAAQHFIILSDIHVNPGNFNEKMLRQAVQEINGEQADAVILTGDLTDDGSDEELTNVKSILDLINKPFYVIPGNHENNWSQSNCKTFSDLWGSDRFTFTHDSLLVIGMNCGPFMKMGDGHIKREDLLWLDKTLHDNLKPGMRVLSINHYPLLDDLDNYQDHVKILQKYPMVTHINGHWHRWNKYSTGGIDGVAVRALKMTKADTTNYGYSMLTIEADSVLVYNKVLGHPATLKFAYPINLKFTPLAESLPASKLPKQFTISRVYTDDASIFTRLGLDGDNVYFGNSLGQLKAVNKRTGRLQWKMATQGMLFSRPAVSNHWVILPTSDKRLIWIDKRTGSPAFEHQSAVPYAADGLVRHGVLYQGSRGTFEAWDIAKRQLLWHYDSLQNYCQAEPVLSGNDLVFGCWDTNLRMLDARTGQLKWQWSNGRPGIHFSPGNVVPAVTRNRVITVAPDRYITCLDRSTGRQLWRWHSDSVRVRESMGLSEDGTTVYAKTMQGKLAAFDATADTCRLLWQTDLGLGYEHAPCIILEHNGVIYCGSRHGTLCAVSAKSHRLLFTYSLGSSEINGFALDHNGDIYCSLIEGTVWRIRRK